MFQLLFGSRSWSLSVECGEWVNVIDKTHTPVFIQDYSHHTSHMSFLFSSLPTSTENHMKYAQFYFPSLYFHFDSWFTFSLLFATLSQKHCSLLNIYLMTCINFVLVSLQTSHLSSFNNQLSNPISFLMRSKFQTQTKLKRMSNYI